MNRINLIALLLLLFFLKAANTNAQAGDECKYLTVLLYLRSNVQANDIIKDFFKTYIKHKEKFVEFNVSNRVDFLGIQEFRKDLNIDNDGIDTALINNAALYRSKYFFESYRSEFLKKIMPGNSSIFSVTFSKPIDNYLVVEFESFDPETNVGTKFGKALQMFFKFASDGTIESVLNRGIAYR